LEPALKPAAQATRTGHIGVLATTGTLQGYLFQNTARRYANGIQVHVQVGEGLVEQVEAGHVDTPETAALLQQYLEPMLAAGVDQIALGCTHYPLLMPLIEQIVRGRAAVIDPAEAVARQVQRILREQKLEAPADQTACYTFYSSGDIQSLQALVERLAPEIDRDAARRYLQIKPFRLALTG
jgi:glutamate racemase